LIATVLNDAIRMARRSERIRNGRVVNLIRTLGAGIFFLLFVFFGRVQGNPEWRGGDVVAGAHLALAALLLLVCRRRDEVTVRSGLALALLDVPMIVAIELAILPTSSNPQELVGSCTAVFILLIFASGMLLNIRLIIATAVAVSVAQAVLQLRVAMDLGNIFSAVGIFAVAAVICAFLTSRLDKLVERTALQLVEAHQTEATLARAVDLESRVIADAGLGVAAVDAQLRLQLWNPYLAALTGLSPESVAGQQPWALLPELRDLEAELPSALAGLAVAVPDRPVKIGGREVWMAITAGPMRSARGEVIGAVVFVRDISDMKRAEEERERLEEQLRMSQKLEAIGSLAGGVAHDFNNLLSVILSYNGFALEAVREGGPLRDDLMEVQNAGKRAATLVRQLLAFSRKQMLEPRPLDLNQVTAELEKMLRRILGEDIDFARKLAPDLGMTHADPSQIEQVLLNLVVNARDAMPEGGKLTIETANVELDDEYTASNATVEPGSYVMLAVTDTGRGMDAKTRERIFEPFFTTKEKGKGTGLGLSMVYGIVKQSGGDIHVYSEPDQGTTFKIYLPRKSSAMIAESRAPTAPTRLTGNETVLVVEDEEAVCNLAKRILGAAGYTVLTAANGGDGLATCERHPEKIHLVLTDVVMPEMSGRVFAERLAKVREGIKVLYMSGYTDNAIAHHGTLDPGTKFIGKPFNAADLARKVREVLDER
jgi:PAS domain S-box-containing protein